MKDSKKVSQLVGVRMSEIPVGLDFSRPHPHTSVGIEVEVEDLSDQPPEMKRWTTTTDGSLVNGTEFVSDPVWGTAITDALVELSDVFKVLKPKTSFRCSTHIHMNILDLMLPQLRRLIYLGVLYEPAFFRMHNQRLDNIFCVPVAASYRIQAAYVTVLEELEDRSSISLRPRRGSREHWLQSKYAAINPNNITTLGTIEYRHMGGVIDPALISDWIDILLQLKTSALLLEDEEIYNPEEVWGEYRNRLDIRDEDIVSGRSIINHFSIWR